MIALVHHPRTVALAALPAWQDDSRALAIMAALREASALGTRLRGLYADHHVDVTGVGSMRFKPVESSAYVNRADRRWDASGEVCQTLWDALDDCRSAWIAARVEVQHGVRFDLDPATFLDRADEIEADSVDAVWSAYLRRDPIAAQADALHRVAGGL